MAAHAPYLTILLIMVVLAGRPLLVPQLMSGHDSLAYPPRDVEFYEGLKAGQILPRWAPDLAFGYGEPTFNFNPPVLYYLVALAQAVGFGVIAAENVTCLVLLALCAMNMYLLAGEFFGRRGALVAAVAYIFAPNLLATLYVRHALADYTAFAFLPLAFWSLYRFALEGHRRHLAASAASTALLLLSSFSVTLTAALGLALLPVWLAWNQRDPRVLARGFLSLVAGVAVAAFFLLPALTETAYVHIARRTERFDFHDHFVFLRQLIASPWGFGFSAPGPHDGMSFAVGPLYLIMAGAALLCLPWIWSARPRCGVAVAFFLSLLAFGAFFSIGQSRWLWELLPVLHPMQFPWRFLSMVALSTAFLSGFPLPLIEHHRRLGVGLTVVLTAGFFAFGVSIAKPQGFLVARDSDFSPENLASKGVAATAREFEPIWVRQFPTTPTQTPLTVLQGQAQVVHAHLTPTRRAFVVDVAQDARFRLHTFYFPGWTLYVDGRREPIDIGSPDGTMEFRLPSGRHDVVFAFTNTPVRLWGTGLSLATVSLLLFSWWRSARAARTTLDACTPPRAS
jgi:hypothetical protein